MARIVDENGDREEADTDYFASMFVAEDCFEDFIRHTKVNVNVVDAEGRTPLEIEFSHFEHFNIYNRERSANRCLRKIISFLEAGTDPRVISPRQGRSLIYIIREKFENCTLEGDS